MPKNRMAEIQILQSPDFSTKLKHFFFFIKMESMSLSQIHVSRIHLSQPRLYPEYANPHPWSDQLKKGTLKKCDQLGKGEGTKEALEMTSFLLSKVE